MNVHRMAVTATLVLATAAGVSAADRPVVQMAVVAPEAASWCLTSAFMFDPGFTPASGAPNIDYEKTLLSPPQAVLAADSGQTPLVFCLGLETIAQAWEKGAQNVIIVAVNGILPAYLLIGQKGLKRLEDLKGKALASNGPNTTATQAVAQILQRGANLMPDRDYNFVTAATGTARMAALTSGKVDGIASYPPISYKLADDGYPVLGSERQYGSYYLQGALEVNRQWAQANRPLVVSIIKTMLQVGRWLKDPTKKNEVIAKLANVTMGGATLGPDYARRVYADVIAVKGGVVDDGYADRALFMSTYHLLTERGLLAESDYPPLDKLVDYSYLNEARRALGMREVKALTP
jgi:hypothetical protein